MKDERLYLIHIGECIERIEEYTSAGKNAFFAETMIQDAVLRNLQIMAESTQRLAAAIKKRHPEIDWQNLAGFRNLLVHHYLGIKLDRVWEIVERELPDLKRKTGAIQTDLGLAE